MSTPRTDALIEAGHITRGDVARWVRQLETELTEMRQAMSQVATNIGNGSFTTMDASHEWMIKEVPEEVRLYCERLRKELAAEREKVAKLREVLAFYAGNFPNDDLGDWQLRICEDEGDKAREAIDKTK